MATHTKAATAAAKDEQTPAPAVNPTILHPGMTPAQVQAAREQALRDEADTLRGGPKTPPAPPTPTGTPEERLAAAEAQLEDLRGRVRRLESVHHPHG